MFGGIGALFSGLALGGVVAAIWLQKQGLEIQRGDLHATLEELKRSTEAQTASSESLAEQIALMAISAQLTALDTLYHHHAERADRYLAQRPTDGGFSQFDADPALTLRIRQAEAKRDRVLRRIDSLIADLEKRSLDDANPATETPADSPAGK